MNGFSIRNKILTVSLGLILLLGITVIVFIRTELSDWLIADMQDHSIELASHYAETLVTPLLTEDFFSLNSLAINAAKEHSEVEYTFVTDFDGNVVAHSFGSLFPTDLLDVNPLEGEDAYSVVVLKTEKGRILDIAVPILSSEIGAFHFGISTWHIEDEIERVTRYIILILFLGILQLVGMDLCLTLKLPSYPSFLLEFVIYIITEFVSLCYFVYI